MKYFLLSLVAVAVVGGDIAAGPSVPDNAAAAHLNAYFEALHAEFPPSPDSAANMQGVMDEGTKIAQSFFPDNRGPLIRGLIQSLTQFATWTPESWDFKSLSEAGDTTEIVVDFTVGNASMVKLGIGNTEVRYRIRGDGPNWTLLSVEASPQQ